MYDPEDESVLADGGALLLRLDRVERGLDAVRKAPRHVDGAEEGKDHHLVALQHLGTNLGTRPVSRLDFKDSLSCRSRTVSRSLLGITLMV